MTKEQAADNAITEAISEDMWGGLEDMKEAFYDYNNGRINMDISMVTGFLSEESLRPLWKIWRPLWRI